MMTPRGLASLAPLARSSRRWLGRHPAQTALAVLGVALGVAVVVSVDVATGSARRAFTLSTEAVTGRATHQVVGGPSGLPETLFRALTVEAGVEPAAPVVEGAVTVEGGQAAGGRSLQLLGLDPFSEGPFRTDLDVFTGPGSSERAAGGVDLGAFLTRPGAALVSASTAAELGAAPGDRLPLAGGGELLLIGVLTPREEGRGGALDGLAITDLATAQELTGQLGRLTRIDLRAPRGAAGEAYLARVRSVLPPGARILEAAARGRSTEAMTRAFRLNLQALSLLALICGLFLIYNTSSFSVVQRRTLLGTLRALGVTRRQVLALVLGEAALVALAGTALGLAGGVLLGQGLVGMVTRTINDLYFRLEVRQLAVPAWSLIKGLVLGLGAPLLAALAPAREAATAPPRAVLQRSELEGRAHRALPRAAAAGLALALVGGLLLAVTPRLVASFAGLFAVLLGLALLTPAATVGMMVPATPLMGRFFGILGRMAARGVVASLSRTAVALAALAVAVSVTVGVGLMIGSFRQTVERWLGSTLQADLYLAPAGGSAGFGDARLDADLPARLAAVPGVARVSSVRRVELEAPAPGPAGRVEVERTRLLALDLDARSYPGFDLRRGDPREVWPAFQEGGAVIVSEVFAYRRGVGVGASLPLPTDRGERSFPIAGVYTDYASDQGLVLMSRRTYERWFDDRRLSALSVFVDRPEEPGRVDEVAAALHRRGPWTVRSNRALRESSLAIFDRTFLITGVLRLLAGLVAFIGVLSALMALSLDRARELGVLRANGLTPGQVWKLVTAQTGLLGAVAGLLSLPLGLVLAAVMVYVINRRSFGWSLELAVSPRVLVEAVLLAVLAAVLAGLYPAWKMSRTPPAAALREE